MILEATSTNDGDGDGNNLPSDDNGHHGRQPLATTATMAVATGTTFQR